jgi:two-component system NarL family sensor kinase
MKNADTQSAINLLDEAIQDVRNVSHNLMPADLSKGLITAIENMSEQMNLPSNTLQVHLHITNNARLLVINKQQSMLIYRIIQELLNNAIKYAQAKNIHINMDCEKNQLKLILTDDGVGFDLDSIIKNGGLGIKNIKERVHYMIGDLQFDSKIGQGTQYQISIPI